MELKLTAEVFKDMLFKAGLDAQTTDKVLKQFNFKVTERETELVDTHVSRSWKSILSALRRETQTIRANLRSKMPGTPERNAHEAYLEVLLKLRARIHQAINQSVTRQDYVKRYQIPSGGVFWFAYVPKAVSDAVRAEFAKIPLRPGVRRKEPFTIDQKSMREEDDRRFKVRYQIVKAIEQSQLLATTENLHDREKYRKQEEVMQRLLQRLDALEKPIPPTYYPLMSSAEREIMDNGRERKYEMNPDHVRKTPEPRLSVEEQGVDWTRDL